MSDTPRHDSAPDSPILTETTEYEIAQAFNALTERIRQHRAAIIRADSDVEGTDESEERDTTFVLSHQDYYTLTKASELAEAGAIITAVQHGALLPEGDLNPMGLQGHLFVSDMFARSMTLAFIESGATNYLEFTFDVPTTDDPEPRERWSFVIQKHDGLTPTEKLDGVVNALRGMLEADRALLADQLSPAERLSGVMVTLEGIVKRNGPGALKGNGMKTIETTTADVKHLPDIDPDTVVAAAFDANTADLMKRHQAPADPDEEAVPEAPQPDPDPA